MVIEWDLVGYSKLIDIVNPVEDVHLAVALVLQNIVIELYLLEGVHN
jgi:hypothetical protein